MARNKKVKQGPSITYSHNKIEICFDKINIPKKEAIDWMLNLLKEQHKKGYIEEYIKLHPFNLERNYYVDPE